MSEVLDFHAEFDRTLERDFGPAILASAKALVKFLNDQDAIAGNPPIPWEKWDRRTRRDWCEECLVIVTAYIIHTGEHP